MKPPALYDLSRFIAGFDFFPWLVMQKMGGAETVSFDVSKPNTGKFKLHEVVQRYESILKPGPALLGMEVVEGDGDQYGHYLATELIKLAQKGKVIPRLKSVLPPKNVEFTVTLRGTRRWPSRNSRDADWKQFAAEIGALVIPDYDVEPISLHERMSLYAGAQMNFFVTNGPVMCCFLSEYPAMGFDVQNSPPQGVAAGGRYAFMLDQHIQVWEPDTLVNIRKHFQLWQKSRWV